MINFVVAPACSGKSTFIKEYFQGWKVLDVLDFQRKMSGNPDDEWISNEGIIKGHFALTEEIVNNVNHDIVVEHTLFKTKRRIDILAAIHEKGNPEINIYIVMPTEERMKENYQKRYPNNKSLTKYKQIKCEYRYMESFDKDQGFEHIYVARSNGEQWLVEEVETFDCKNEFEWPIYEIDLYELTKEVTNAQGDNCKKLEHLIRTALWEAEEAIGRDITVRFIERKDSGNPPMDLWVNLRAKDIAEQWRFVVEEK